MRRGGRPGAEQAEEVIPLSTGGLRCGDRHLQLADGGVAVIPLPRSGLHCGSYLSYRSEDGAGFAEQMSDGAAAKVLLEGMMPDRAPVTLVQGLPMFGGALVLVLGAVAVGSGYSR